MALKSLILLIVLILSPLNAFEADFLYADSDAPLIAQNTLNLSLKKKLRAPQKPPRKRTTRVIKARKKFPKQPASSSSIKAQNEFQLGQEMSVLYKKKNLNNRIVSNIDFFIYKNSLTDWYPVLCQSVYPRISKSWTVIFIVFFFQWRLFVSFPKRLFYLLIAWILFSDTLHPDRQIQ